MRTLLTVISALLCTTPLAAQEMKAPPLPTPQNSKGSGKDLQVEYLAQQYGISAAEAAERVDVLRDVQQIVSVRSDACCWRGAAARGGRLSECPFALRKESADGAHGGHHAG